MVLPRRGNAVIVGGGIGGLSAATALSLTGWSVTVLERHAEAADAGSGISLWPNAMRVLDQFGIAELVRAVAAPVPGTGGLRVPSGRWLTRANPTDAPLVEVVLLHRADLHSALRSAFPPDCLRLGAVADAIVLPDKPGESARVAARDGGRQTEFTADVIVVADGIHSALRSTVAPESRGPAYSGYTTWRGITPPGAVRADAGGETWGRGAKFGYLPLTNDRVYWFAELAAPRGSKNDDEQAALLSRFGGWHSPISSLVAAVPREQIIRTDVEYLPDLPVYARGCIALLGDAAHAMTPDLGQGGCQAIEDASVLASQLAAHDDVASALLAYDRDRRPRTQAIARAARRMGNFSQLSNPVGVLLRNTLISMTPTRAALRPLAHISNWAPPPLPRT